MGHGFELRKKSILDKLNVEGFVLVKEIAEGLGISETTVRRDLNELDAMGVLRQVYGGAARIEQEGPGIRFSLSNRSTSCVDEKRWIGRYGAQLVQDGDILYIDAGTTSWEMIPHLRDRRDLTIISNSVRLLQCLDMIGHHSIIQLGGTLRPQRLDTIGTLAQIGIEQLRGFKAFQGGDGMDIDFGLSAIDHESAQLARIILSNARETIVLADHSKFDNPSLLYKIIEIDRINHIVTDRPLTPRWEEKCRSGSVHVHVAPCSPPRSEP